ncbi:MAG TPA: DUF3472 domain-containing protein [Patescibacteria group bacterium]|nr:DUF3472 domain-containing protein [Patescibacteria group bacterium]
MFKKTNKRSKNNKFLNVSRYKKLIVVCFVMLFAGLGVYLLLRTSALTPQGTYTNWDWSPPADGFSSLKHSLTVEAVTPDAPYFWSHQFQFVGGDGGYIGLQSHGSRVDGTIGKTAVFSIFSAGIEATSGACVVQQAGFDGYNTSGSSCRVPYEWVLGRTYQMRTAMISRDSTGTWWGGWVKDTSTGVETFIAQIKTPATWKGIGAWSSMWTEYFGVQPSSCDTLPYSRVRFGSPTANDVVAPTGTSNYLTTTADCKTSVITNTANGMVQEMGNANFVSPDTTSPVIAVSQPTQGETSGSPLSIAASATDERGVTGMDVLIGGTLVKSVNTNSISTTWQAPTQKGKVGRAKQYTVTVRAKDAAGNVSSKSVTVYVR